MALELKISEQSYNKNTATAVFEDVTGNYDISLNPGGYGAPNADRSSLALVLSVSFSNGDSEEISFVDPLTDTTYSYEFQRDGAYRVALCSIEYEAGAYDPTLMSVGRVFYSVLDNKVYEVIEENGVNVVKETSEVFDSATEANEILYYLVQSYAESKSVDLFCASCDGGKIRDEYNDIKRVIDSMVCNFNQGHYSEVNNVVKLGEKISL